MQIATPTATHTAPPRPSASPLPVDPPAGNLPIDPPVGVAWPASPWKTWTRTADLWAAKHPANVMTARQFEPNQHAVAQADFAFGGNYNAHGVLDVFAGTDVGHFASRDAAIVAAQALTGRHGIVGVFAVDAEFAVRQLLVSGADRRDGGWTAGGVVAPSRPRPEHLKQLRDVGERHGSWGHGDYRSLSGLRGVDATLLAFVQGRDVVSVA